MREDAGSGSRPMKCKGMVLICVDRIVDMLNILYNYLYIHKYIPQPRDVGCCSPHVCGFRLRIALVLEGST